MHARTPQIFGRPCALAAGMRTPKKATKPTTRLLPLALAFLVSLASFGCSRLGSYVKTDDAALGRVIVYRNGVAYYERRARIEADNLTLHVPGDKLDDFLKSLTVSDARTHEALPLSYPSRTDNTPGMLDMTIRVPGAGTRDVVLTYVTEAPAWKPSYRVMVDGAGKVTLQAWAIVDNTSGEDWQSVRVGVGSSSALAFRYDLHSIRQVYRETLQSQDTFAKAPPTGGSLYAANAEPAGGVLGELGDEDIKRPDGHPDHGRDKHAGRSPAPRESEAQAAAPAAKGMANATPADDRVAQLARNLRGHRGTIVVEGYADAGESEADSKALDRANLLRNQLILQGVAPAQVQVASRGVVPGRKAGVRLVEQAAPTTTAGKQPGATTPEDAEPIGESHFESGAPMTVGRGTSAMVSVLDKAAPGEIVYLYDAEATRGDARYAFRAVRFENPTPSTLESGPMTVYGAAGFIGEGLTEAIPPRSAAVVPFALDRQVVVEHDESSGDRVARLEKLARGVLTTEVRHWRTTKLKLTNRQRVATVVLVRHTVPRGWTLGKSPKVAEQYGDARLFRIELPAGESRSLEIEETTPMTRTLDLRSPVAMDLVRVWLETPQADAPLVEDMRKLLKLNAEMASHEEAIESLRQRGEEFRARLDELHGQIVSLELVKTAGSLMTHLKTKMKEISERVQGNTIAIVDHQQKLMLARVAFNAGVSELTLSVHPATASR